MTKEEYPTYLKKRYGGYAQQIETYYPVESFESPWWAAVNVLEDSLMICPVRSSPPVDILVIILISNVINLKRVSDSFWFF